jgi:hypothetical protein
MRHPIIKRRRHLVPDSVFEKAQKRTRDVADPDARLKSGGGAKYLLSAWLAANDRMISCFSAL